MPIPTETMRERRIWRVTVMASAVLAALSILFSVLLYEQGQDRAHTNRVLALKAQRLAGEIQAQRINAIRTSCEAQNQRNVKTIKTLDGLIAKLPSKQRPRAQAGRDNTVLLINALAPKQNCAKVVQEAAPVPPKPVSQPKPAPTR
jgi:negative regulator of sigma E activity